MKQILDFLIAHGIYAVCTSESLVQGYGYIQAYGYLTPEKAPFSIQLIGEEEFKVRFRDILEGRTYVKVTTSWRMALNLVLNAVGYKEE